MSAQDIESEIVGNQMARDARMIWLLRQIGAPDLPSGDYSYGKKVLWNVYKKLEAEDDKLRAMERGQILDAYGYID